MMFFLEQNEEIKRVVMISQKIQKKCQDLQSYSFKEIYINGRPVEADSN